MSKTKWYAKPIYLLVALALVLSLGIVAVPMAGTVEANDITWTEYPNNPVFAPAYKAYYPSVIKIDGTYYMYTSDGSTINYATSTNGISWIDEDSTGVSGNHPWVIQDDSYNYKMYVWDGTHPGTPSCGIKYATSTDGINWSDLVGVNITSLPLAPGIGYPSGLYDWVVYYNGPGDYEAWGDDNFGLIVYSTSSDGINWAAGQRVTINGIPGSYTRPTVVRDGATYHMFIGYQPAGCPHIDGYSNSGIGHATGTSPTSFTASDGNPIFTRCDGPDWRDLRTYTPDVIKEGDTYKMWFTGKGSSYSIGYATAAPPTLPMSEFQIDHAKIDFKKKPDDVTVTLEVSFEGDLTEECCDTVLDFGWALASDMDYYDAYGEPYIPPYPDPGMKTTFNTYGTYELYTAAGDHSDSETLTLTGLDIGDYFEIDAYLHAHSTADYYHCGPVSVTVSRNHRNDG